MENDILHKEKVNVNLSTKQWVISGVLLIDFVFFSILFYQYTIGKIPNNSFRLDDIIGVSVVLIMFSAIILIVVLSRGYSITIDHNKLTLKHDRFYTASINKDSIKSFSKITKKEYLKLLRGKGVVATKKHRRTKMMESYIIKYPNFVVYLTDGRKIFIETNKESAFEYSMNKMLNLKYV